MSFFSAASVSYRIFSPAKTEEERKQTDYEQIEYDAIKHLEMECHVLI